MENVSNVLNVFDNVIKAVHKDCIHMIMMGADGKDVFEKLCIWHKPQLAEKILDEMIKAIKNQLSKI